MSAKKIAVLMGGWSSERPVSLVSGAAVSAAAKRLGHMVIDIDVTREIASQLAEASPDIAINALHGPWGEDGHIQAVLELAQIPYTHSGVLASALAMDKNKTKAVLAAAGLDVPKGQIIARQDIGDSHPMHTPYVVKPNADGSSFGVFIVRKGDNRPPAALLSPEWSSGDDLLVEEFIAGRELTVAVLGDKALGVTEIKTGNEFYDYDAKYSAGGSTHILNPTDLPVEIAQRAKEAAILAHKTLGCRGLTRTDFRYDPDLSRLVVLETNTQPGMTPTSLAPEQAGACGMDFDGLVAWLLEDASCLR